MLYRTDRQVSALEEALQKSGMPFQKRSHENYPDEDAWDARADRIALMTLHASKGLEFPIVFIVGCEEGLLPFGFPGTEMNVEEERRLFFVGMTRAKERLHLSYARERVVFGKVGNRVPSRFLRAIEKALLDYQKMERLRPIERKTTNQLSLFSSDS